MASMMPPLPPEVVAQQSPPSMRFMQDAGAAIQSGQQFDPMALVEDRMNQVAALLKETADVLVVEKPNLMPILQRSVQGLSVLMQEVQASRPQPPAPAPEQSQMQPPVDGASMVSMS